MSNDQPRSKTLRSLGVITAAYQRVSALSGGRRPAPTMIDRRLALRVLDTSPLADDVVALTFVDPAGGQLPGWRPGAHLDLELTGGRLRQYSLCGDPNERDRYRIAVRRIADGGGGSIAAHALRAGDDIVVRGPRNAFPYLVRDRYLFVAGGIGITPILPMVRDAARRGADWRLVYTGRASSSMPFLDELRALGGTARLHVRPDDEFGVPTATEILAHAPQGAALYVCGPPALVAALRAAPLAGIDGLHSERFSAPPVVNGAPFELELVRSGRVVSVASDESALTALRRELPDVAYSCRQGFCGTCPVGVISGTAMITHRDRCLTETERLTLMAPCVSRADGRVLLDL